MQPKKMALALGLVFVLSHAVALDDLVIAPASFEHCSNLIVPVLIHTLSMGTDLDRFAALLEKDQDLWYTDSHHMWFEPPFMTIMVDILRMDPGGELDVGVIGPDGVLWYERTVEVPPVSRSGDITRSVIPVAIQQEEGGDVFRRSGIYRIVATSQPFDERGRACGSSASTSILVEVAQ